MTSTVDDNHSLVSHQASMVGNPEVTIEGKRIVIQKGKTILEVAEANGLQIEAGCRMGVCGADPICVHNGMGNLSKISSNERTALESITMPLSRAVACWG